MLVAPVSKRHDNRSSGQGPPRADPRYLRHRSEVRASPSGSDVPARQREIGQKQNRGPAEIAESRRQLAPGGTSIQPGDDRPDPEQNRDQKQTNLRSFETKKVGRKFLQ